MAVLKKKVRAYDMRGLCRCLLVDQTDAGLNSACNRLARTINQHDDVLDLLAELYVHINDNPGRLLKKDLNDRVLEYLERDDIEGRLIKK